MWTFSKTKPILASICLGLLLFIAPLQAQASLEDQLASFEIATKFSTKFPGLVNASLAGQLDEGTAKQMEAVLGFTVAEFQQSFATLSQAQQAYNIISQGNASPTQVVDAIKAFGAAQEILPQLELARGVISSVETGNYNQLLSQLSQQLPLKYAETIKSIQAGVQAIGEVSNILQSFKSGNISQILTGMTQVAGIVHRFSPGVPQALQGLISKGTLSPTDLPSDYFLQSGFNTQPTNFLPTDYRLQSGFNTQSVELQGFDGQLGSAIGTPNGLNLKLNDGSSKLITNATNLTLDPAIASAINTGGSELANGTAKVAEAAGKAPGIDGKLQEASAKDEATDAADKQNPQDGTGGSGGNAGCSADGRGTNILTALGDKLTGGLLSKIAGLGSLRGNITSILAAKINDMLGGLTGGVGGGLIGGKGVPVIEQKGELLTSTTENKNINNQSCLILSLMLTLQTDVQAEQSKIVATNVIEAAKAVTEANRANIVPDLQAYAIAAARAEGKRILKDISNKNLSASAKLQIYNAVTTTITVDNYSAITKAGTPTRNPNTSDVSALVDPVSGVRGTLANIQQAVYNRLSLELATKGAEVDQGQGFAPNKRCLDPGWKPGEVCQNEIIILPGSAVRGLEDTALGAGFRLAESSDNPLGYPSVTASMLANMAGISKTGEIPAPGGSVPQIQTVPPPGAGQQILDSIINDSLNEATKQGGDINDLIGNVKNLLSIVCRSGVSVPLLCDDQNAGSGNQGGNTGGSTPPPVPQPSLTMSTTTLHAAGTTYTQISWSSNDLLSCKVTSYWVTFGDGNEATTTPRAFFQPDAVVAKTGSAIISHPALFRSSATALALGANDEVPPASQSLSIRNSLVINTTASDIYASTVTQTSEYTPNLAGVDTDDSILYTLGGFTVNANGSASSTEISDRLRSAFLNPDIEADRRAEFDKYQYAGSTTLKIIRGIEVGILPNELTYGLECKGVDGSTLNKEARVIFAK
ncbi:MAG: hypothetical protein Q8Q18_02220 [bacterium]|nr:hypothetical protein [bacterium]